MRDYAKIPTAFWASKTGRAIMRLGSDVIAVSLYLQSAPLSNMLGLFYLPKAFISIETGIPLEGACKALQSLIEVGFCDYDDDAQMVWVFDMAETQIAKRLKPNDNQAKGVQREYDALPDCRFLADFFDRYGDAFCMDSRRDPASPIEAPPKPLASQEHNKNIAKQAQGPSGIPPTPVTEVQSRKSAKPSKKGIPPDFCISDRVKAWAEEKGFDHLDAHLESFKDKAAANGYAYVDWDAAFMNAIRGDWAGLRKGRTGTAHSAHVATLLNADEQIHLPKCEVQ